MEQRGSDPRCHPPGPAAAAQQVGIDRFGPAGAPHRGQHAAHGLGSARRQPDRELLPHQFFSRHAQQCGGGRVGLQHPAAAGVHHQHRFAGHLEQVAVAQLGLAEAGVIPLHRQLRLQQALLQGSGGALVMAKGKYAGRPAPAGGQQMGGVAHGHRATAADGVVDMAPACCAGRRLGQQGIDLGGAVIGDGVGPALADPALADLLCQAVTAERQVQDQALRVQHQGQVRCGGDQRGQRLCVQAGQAQLGRGEPTQRGRRQRLFPGHAGDPVRPAARAVSGR